LAENLSRSLLLREREHSPEPAVALTFDDGPSDLTVSILDALRDYGAHATFFVIGRSLAGREETLRRAVQEGHELGNHTTSHPDLTRCGRWRIRRELARTNHAIERTVGARPRLFRPPYMAHDERVLTIAGKLGLMWTVLDSDGVSPKDYRMDDAGEIAEALVSSIRPGAIVDLHDGRPPREPQGSTLPTRHATAEAVPLVLGRLIQAGYRVVTVSELFELDAHR
jgi:peptidoglycan/xylan/chitin deacetylase (PgdA/CDA1 family)